MRILFSTILLFSICFAGIAQTTMIRYVKEEEGQKRLLRIEFFDIKTEKVVKTVDAILNNPFNHYSFPTVDNPSSLNHTYDLNGVTVSQVFPDSLFKKRPDWKKISSIGLVRGASETSYLSVNSSLAIVYYTFQTYAIEGSLMGMTALFVYDNNGNEILKRISPEIDIRQMDLSPSGRYLTYVTGKYDRDYIPFPNGFWTHDLQQPNRSLFVKAKVPGLHFLADEKLIEVNDTVTSDNSTNYLYRVLDFPNGKIYEKVYSMDEMSKILNITPECIIFRENLRRDYYNKDFTAIEMFPEKN